MNVNPTDPLDLKPYRQAAERLLSECEIPFQSETQRDAMLDAVFRKVQKDCCQTNLPKGTESLALSLVSRKTAALAFDRVYSPGFYADAAPQSIGFYGGSQDELAFCCFATLYSGVEHILPGKGHLVLGMRGVRGDMREDHEVERDTMTQLCSGLSALLGRTPTVFYHDERLRASEMPNGAMAVLHTVRLYFRFGVAMMFILPVAMVINLYRDFHHPEWWGDWQHNPHFYFPLVLLMLLCVLPYILYVLCGIRRLQKEIKQRATYLDHLRKLNQK